MKLGKIKIQISKEDIQKNNRMVSREVELENSTGWSCKHRVHKSEKAYTRKPKHKKNYSDFE